MESYVDEDAIRKLAQKIAKDVKTEADLGDFSKLLKKIVVETALDAELTNHLGYDKNDTKMAQATAATVNPKNALRAITAMSNWTYLETAKAPTNRSLLRKASRA